MMTLGLLAFLLWQGLLLPPHGRGTEAFSPAARLACRTAGPRDGAAGHSGARLFSSPPTRERPPAGSPPGSVAGGGGPRGPPAGGGGPPGGGGGPPPQTAAQKLLEVVLDAAFGLLYVGDDIGLRDSSKNLRVLWTRAILNRLGKIDDPVAFQLLPERTRWVVDALVDGGLLPDSVVEKLDWIVRRTNFIDGQLDSFLDETSSDGDDGGSRRQVLVLGSGYDTRCLRYGDRAGLDFFCVDLPAVAENSRMVVERYLPPGARPPAFVPFDLNDASDGGSLLGAAAGRGLVVDGSVPTMVLCEAVLFYLEPGAARAVTSELFSGLPGARFCLTDNLSKVGVVPGGGPEGPPNVAARARCAAWLGDNGRDLVEHDSIWGGAIHFVGASSSSGREG